MYSPDNNELDALLFEVKEAYQTGDKHALDQLFERLMPFCLRVCSKTCGHYINEYDEEASIARLAIIEALEKYDADKGSYLFFLGQVIRSRIIDHKRKEKKHSHIPFAFLSQNGSNLTDMVDERFFEEIIDDLARREEIIRLKRILLDYDINFEDLAKNSPRQSKSKQDAHYIANLLAQEPSLSSYLLERKMLPMKELEDKWKVNRKIADRYRKFIITAAIIQLNDFPYLNTILPAKGGDKNGF